MALAEKIIYYIDEIELRRQYRTIMKKLPPLLNQPKSGDNLLEVNFLQSRLFSFVHLSMDHPDFFTAERTEKIWDLLHESKHYLLGSPYQSTARERCFRFPIYLQTNERMRKPLRELRGALES